MASKVYTDNGHPDWLFPLLDTLHEVEDQMKIHKVIVRELPPCLWAVWEILMLLKPLARGYGTTLLRTCPLTGLRLETAL